MSPIERLDLRSGSLARPAAPARRAAELSLGARPAPAARRFFALLLVHWRGAPGPMR